MNKPITNAVFADHTRANLLHDIVARAARAVPPLWPLEAPIAVNPLADLESMAFGDALAATHTALPLSVWRGLLDAGRIDRAHLRDEAIRSLGGFERAFSPIGPDLSPLDLLMARLLEVDELPPAVGAGSSGLADALVAKWCAAFFSPPSGNMMGDRKVGLYRAVLPLIAIDPAFHALSNQVKDLCAKASEDPLVALTENLAALDVDPSDYLGFLKGVVERLPGWAGHVRWRSEHAEEALAAPAPVTMVDYLALWTLVLRASPEELVRCEPTDHAADIQDQLARHYGLSAKIEHLFEHGRDAFARVCRLPAATLGFIFMQAAERSYRENLVTELAGRSADGASSRPAAQLVFCIDVRSEPFRRAIEGCGEYETAGYAGFFGVAMALRPIDGSAPHRQLPVLLKPQYSLDEAAVPGLEQRAAKAARSNASFRTARWAFNASKLGFATSFSTAEASGLPALAAMLGRSISPRLARRITDWLGGGNDACALAPAPADTGMALEQRVEAAKSFFSLTGLVPEAAARLVVFVGHGGSATNNPFAGTLDCGACGGHRGGINARVLADILNSGPVRNELAAAGLIVPDDTRFLAAEHDTTIDKVTIFDEHLVPETHRAELEALRADLAAAGSATRAERASRLRCSSDDLAKRAAHWAEVRPEWGLAGNAAFIVGPRSMTRHMNLEGRAFLHSYAWEKDPTGSALEVILTAPLVVAQWINCQYLLSTLDNERFGAGDKTTHNILGGIGVVQGNSNDLRIGLPLQSLFDDDGLPYHLPQRLLVIVEAPRDRIEEIVDRHQVLQDLFDNEWVQLVAVDPIDGSTKCWRPRPRRTFSRLGSTASPALSLV